MSPRVKVATAGGAAVLLGLLAYLAFQNGQDEDDRPPIIIENPTIRLRAEKANSRWDQHGSSRSYHQSHQRGRNVDSFVATTGSGTSECTRSGESVTITLTSGQIRVIRHKPWFPPFRKHHTDIEFGEAGTLALEEGHSGADQIVALDTDSMLVSFTTGSGDPCQVQNGRIEVRQVHMP